MNEPHIAPVGRRSLDVVRVSGFVLIELAPLLYTKPI